MDITVPVEQKYNFFARIFDFYFTNHHQWPCNTVRKFWQKKSSFLLAQYSPFRKLSTFLIKPSVLAMPLKDNNNLKYFTYRRIWRWRGGVCSTWVGAARKCSCWGRPAPKNGGTRSGGLGICPSPLQSRSSRRKIGWGTKTNWNLTSFCQQIPNLKYSTLW